MVGDYVESAALVHGYVARVLAHHLRRASDNGAFVAVPPDGRELVMRTVRAIERAGEAWVTARASDIGSSEAPVAETGARSVHDDEITIDDAAGVLGLTARRVRSLAAGGLGRKVGGRWVLDRSAVYREVERRGAA